LTDLERFFRRIVSNLAATDAVRLGQPLPLADVPSSIVPYRSNRRALQVETSEEYEMVLLRLCAGEGGFVRAEPEEVRKKFEEEVRSTNPDLEVIHRFENVVLTLRPEWVDLALQATPATFDAPAPPAAPAPPVHEPPEETVEDDFPIDDVAQAEESAGSQCVYCGGALPVRAVNFCPHCGQSQVAMVCPECHADVEPGWRHCVSCGLALGGR
jgi:hypothetical protein